LSKTPGLTLSNSAISSVAGEFRRQYDGMDG
jgi:hypothetical protein